jgi:hypothetical protein
MKKAVRFAFCVLILTVPAKGQQVGAVDLTNPPAMDNLAAMREGLGLPNGCKELGGSVGDGAIIPRKNQPHEIRVEITDVRNKVINAGSFSQVEVRLRNSGKYPIKLPWSTDANIIEKNQNPSRLAWEVGNFQVLLDRSDRLKNLGQSLYGSEFSKGSMITIQPGEWIIAVIKFKLELEYPTPDQVIRTGERYLQVEWEQSSHTETLDPAKCEIMSGFFTYRNFYFQQNPSVNITISRSKVQ